MSGFSQALLEDYDARLDDTGKDYVHRIGRAVERMTQLIDDLLSLSRITRGELARREVDVTAMCASIVDELRIQSEPRRVDIEIEPELSVSADPGLLNVLLRNLLGNAWKFTSKNAEARIEIGSQNGDGERVLFVRDNGVGFDMKYAEQLFAPFQRLHTISEFPGTGIGLATVQRIVNKHGGRVWAESEPGRGTTIRFTL
jgi:signal transduction histidine kinase